MPDTLVICCAPNNQNILHAAQIAQKVSTTRPDLPIYPVLTRADPDEHAKLEKRRTLIRKAFRFCLNRFSDKECERYWNQTENQYRSLFLRL